MYAHYFKAGKKHQLVITEKVQLNNPGKSFTHNFDSKKELNQYVKDNNLTKWNF